MPTKDETRKIAKEEIDNRIFRPAKALAAAISIFMILVFGDAWMNLGLRKKVHNLLFPLEPEVLTGTVKQITRQDETDNDRFRQFTDAFRPVVEDIVKQHLPFDLDEKVAELQKQSDRFTGYIEFGQNCDSTGRDDSEFWLNTSNLANARIKIGDEIVLTVEDRSIVANVKGTYLKRSTGSPQGIWYLGQINFAAARGLVLTDSATESCSGNAGIMSEHYSRGYVAASLRLKGAGGD